MIGGNRDQAKMAGTPAQVTKAVEDSTQLSLRDAIRKEQSQTDMAESERARAEQARQGSLAVGGLDSRVDQLVAKIGQGTSLTPRYSIDQKTLATSIPQAPANLAQSLNGFLNGEVAETDKGTKAIEIAKGLGIAPPASGESPEAFRQRLEAKLAEVMPSVAKETADAVAKGIQDYSQVTLGQLWEEDATEATKLLGSIEDLAMAIGMEPSEVRALNLPALKEKLEAVGARDFSYVKDLQRRLGDPYTSEAERTSIIRELRRLGASGIRGTEEEYTKLQEAVKQGEMVTINGQAMSLEEALSDSTLSAMAKAYFEGDQATKEKMSQGMPELTKLWDKYSGALREASSKLSGAIESQANQVAEASNLGKGLSSSGNYSLSNETLTKLIPEAGQWGVMPSEESKAIIANLRGLPQDFVSWLDGEIASGKVDLGVTKIMLSQGQEAIADFMKNPESLRDYLSWRAHQEVMHSVMPDEPIWKPTDYKTWDNMRDMAEIDVFKADLASGKVKLAPPNVGGGTGPLDFKISNLSDAGYIMPTLNLSGGGISSPSVSLSDAINGATADASNAPTSAISSTGFTGGGF
jgi:hypothetical protein